MLCVACTLPVEPLFVGINTKLLLSLGQNPRIIWCNGKSSLLVINLLSYYIGANTVRLTSTGAPVAEYRR